MKYTAVYIFLFLYFINTPAHCLTALDTGEMKKHTGQSGISIAIDNAVIYKENSSIKLIDGDENSPGYISLNNTQSLYILETGHNNENTDNKFGHISIDVLSKSREPGGYNSPYLEMSCNDWKGKSYFKAGEIDFSSRKIGSIFVEELKHPKWHFYIGGHSSGIDMEMGFKLELTKFEYAYGPESENLSFQLTGLNLCSDFRLNSSDSPDDPSTWQSAGEFKIGDLKTNNPLKIDVGLRKSDNSPVVFLTGSLKGSMRVENIKMGNRDFGPAAIDGINVHRIKIEFPGRGLGRSS